MSPPESPYPNGILDRLRRVEDAVTAMQVTTSSNTTISAVHTEQIVGIREDVTEIKARVSRLMISAWALVIVSIPIATSLIVMVARGAQIG